MSKKKPNINKLKVILTALLLFFGGIFVFIGWFVWAIVTDKPPTFFPLDNPQGIYRITKGCPQGQGWEKEVELSGDAYCLEYTGKGVFQDSESDSHNFFRITIGNSQIDLESFVGKRVKNIHGKYASSSKQCIRDECIDVGGPWVVVNLQKLEIAE